MALIYINDELKCRLDALKASKSQSYTDIVEKLINYAPGDLWSKKEVSDDEEIKD